MEMMKILKGAAAALVLSFGFANAGQAATVTGETLTGSGFITGDLILPNTSLSFGESFGINALAVGTELNAVFGFNNQFAGAVSKVFVTTGSVASVFEDLQFTFNGLDVFNITGSAGVALPEFSGFFVNLLNGSNTVSVSGKFLGGSINPSYSATLVATPIPAAGVLFGSVLLAGGLYRRRKMVKEIGLPA